MDDVRDAGDEMGGRHDAERQRNFSSRPREGASAIRFACLSNPFSVAAGCIHEVRDIVQVATTNYQKPVVVRWDEDGLTSPIRSCSCLKQSYFIIGGCRDFEDTLAKHVGQ